MNETFTLANNIKIPKIGFGTWMIKNEDAAKNVQDAIQVGYRHIDTAEAYQNEQGVGEGIHASGINRQEIFVTTKLAAEIKNYQEAISAIDQSLKNLNLDYIDMMIIHSPKPWEEFQGKNHYFEGNLEAWHALEKAYQDGKLRTIGVSNFEIVDLENILKNGHIKPMVNQILVHIGHTPMELIEFSQKNHILVEAYSPIAHGEMIHDKTILAIADKYNVTIPQLAVRYCLQLGLLPLPKTENIEHMKNNKNVDFVISNDDMMKLKKIDHFD
ncbi:aldo/keto reductase family [Melissococcus plutonius DAT561]|uniref:Oxidoreductase of aldoketo reductase family, subgroup 1 n=2 Tax=Melissococcus plutonius TaxID=33970 RepID=A0A2Z5Y4D7_9ENTE|nr:aldo/keto reductase [Melissococcus plutonius]BAL62747.1 aldo/keto reductase family [Melissococcus plutonius DAT561]BBC61628.1 oxidoreductase of aldoketo reductase family, subgroup 1 [Melissococcus plutonius]